MSHAAVAAHIGSLGGPPSATEAATMAQSLGHNSADAVHCFMCASQVSCRPSPSLTIAPVRVRTCSSARIRVRARSRACVSARRRVHVHTLEWRRRVRAHTPACARGCVAHQACGGTRVLGVFCLACLLRCSVLGRRAYFTRCDRCENGCGPPIVPPQRRITMAHQFPRP